MIQQAHVRFPPGERVVEFQPRCLDLKKGDEGFKNLLRLPAAADNDILKPEKEEGVFFHHFVSWELFF